MDDNAASVIPVPALPETEHQPACHGVLLPPGAEPNRISTAAAIVKHIEQGLLEVDRFLAASTYI
jgi:hypothetical protein